MDPEIIRATRRHLNAGGPWIEPEDFEASHFGYGCPRHLVPVLDQPINDEPTYTDLLADAATVIGRPLRYLELGVSVGKNFAVMAGVLDGAELFGFDWEAINPSLARRFDPIDAGPNPSPDLDDPILHYRSGTNRVTYIRGDIRRPDAWRPLAEHRFHLIFSDALHRGEALLHEYDMMNRLDLIDPSRFFMLWDDLDPDPDHPMTSAFRAIADDLSRRHRLDPEQVFTIGVNGWLGQHEHNHLVGVVNNLNITRSRYDR